jgi:hypothetical protein
MAKIRRIIRKLKPPRYQPLDEQLWPVIVALAMLGGFTMGTLAVYLRFDDPRWYANAITWLVVAALLYGGAAVTLTLVDNRAFRRSMQLAILLGLLVHAVLLVVSIELDVFGRAMQHILARQDLTKQRPAVTVPDYVEPTRHSRIRQDFTRPVETETPQPEPEPIQRQPTEPETPPPEPQPTPVPEPEQTVQPNLLKQPQPDQEAPRFSDQDSRLTRRMTPARTPMATTAAAAVATQQPAPASPSSLQAQDSALERRQTQTQVARQAAPQEPATPEIQPAANVARRTPQQAPQTESSATPTLERQVARPIQVPRTQVDLAGAPAEARRTRPAEIQPQTTMAQRQVTASPERPQQPAEPTPEVERSTAQEPQRRQLPTQQQPELAQAPVSVPNQRTRATARPSVATAAREVSPADAPARPQAAAAEAVATAVPRAATSPPTPADHPASHAAEPTAPTTTPPSATAAATRPPLAPAAPQVAQADSPAPARRTPTPLQPPTPATADSAVAASASQLPATDAAPQPLAGALTRSDTQTPVAPALASPAEPAAPSPNTTVQLPPRTAPATAAAPSVTSPPAAAAPPRRQIADRSAPAPATAAQISQPAPVAAGEAAPAQPQAVAVAAARQPTASSAATASAEPAASTPAAAPAAVTAPAVARRQADAAGSELAAAASAPEAVPRRPSAAPQMAARTSAEAAPTAAAETAAQAPAPMAVATAAARQAAASGPVAAQTGAEPAVAAAGAASPTGTAQAATRRPRGEQAPALAASPLASTARRQEPTTAPHLTTFAADVTPPAAAAQGESDQPRPTLASVARQPAADPTATRSQPSLEVQVAGTTTQIGRSAARPLQPGDAPSIAPEAPPAPTVARATTRTPVAASPENVESPAAAEAARGVGSPSAEPARMALSKAVTGTAGIGQGRNLDRARPAADSPALVASAAARRDHATQETPPGPALSPQASALVRRAAAGSQVPSASLPSRADTEIALAAGARQAEPLAASASAALTRADAAAPAGPVTGTVGATEVDLGPSRSVSEGQTGRGSGGGQPTLNFDTDVPRIARRSQVGGAPLAALTSPTAAQVPTAPATDGGGQPLMPVAEMTPTAIARTDAGGLSPASGGPAQSTEMGPPTEVSQAPTPDKPVLARADLAQAVPDLPTVGGGSDEDEEERKRRLARAAAQALALATPTTAEGINAQADTAADASQALAARGAAVERTSAATMAAPRSGGPEADNVQAASAASAPAVSRTEVPPDVPAGPTLASAGGPVGARAERISPAPGIAVSAAPAGELAETAPQATSAQLAAAAGTGVARAETGQAVGSGAPDASAVDVGQPSAMPATSVARAAQGTNIPAADTPIAAPQMARAGRPAPGAPPLEVAVVLPGAAGGTPVGRPAAGQPADAAAISLARTEPSAAAPAGGSPGDASATPAAEPSAMIPAAPISRMAAAETASGATAAGGGQPDVTATAEIEPTLARRSDTAQTAPASLPPTTVAALPAGEFLAGGAPDAQATGADPRPLATAAVRLASGGGTATGRANLDAAASSTPASGGELLAAAQYQRAEAAEAAIGEPQLGGGTAAPTRAAAGPRLAAELRAPAVSLAGVPQSGGHADGRPLAAAGGEARNLAAGRIAPPSPGPVGAMAAQAAIDVAVAAAPGVAAGIRLTSPSTADGPALGQLANTGTPLKRAERSAPPAGSVQVAMVDAPSRGAFDADAAADHSPGDALHKLDMARQSTEGGLAVNVDAVAGPGGLGAGMSVDVGLNNRRAVRDSMQVSHHAARFVRHQVGGLPATSTAAVVPAESFRRRPRDAAGGWGQGLGSPPPLTEETIDHGLNFLVRQQLADGSWSLQSIPGEQAALVTDTGATALALLAFQGAGYNHREHRYADVVRGGIEYLLKNQKADGDLFLPMDDQSNQSVWLYSHALAALALCEAYGMTQDPSLKEPAQKALNFIVASQHPERGAWRYAPQVGSDTSVSGWMMMALKSGQLGGLEVPERVYASIRQWLDKSQASDREPHLYRYNPLAPNTPEQAHGRQATKTMTSVGLLMRLYLGWRRDNPNMIRGAQYLAENLPSLGTRNDPQRDTYYWYYATQVMFHMGGDYWKAWNERLHPLLTETQLKQGPLAGSWDPRGSIPDRWAPHAGRLYVTTMNILSLEVYYRHLPLYEDTLK